MSDELADLRGLKLPFDIDEVVPECHECIRQQLEKYNKFVDNQGKSAAGKFVVPCRGIYKNNIDPATISIYRDEAQTDLAYSVVQTLAVGAAALVIPSVDYVIPIQFVENPVIRGSEDTATYYISITIDAVGVTLLPGNVSLNKYSITAQEISE